MLLIYDIWDGFLGFMAQGGQVLWLIFGLAVLMWAMLLERFSFLLFSVSKERERIIAEWQARPDHSSTYAHWIRDAILSRSQAMIQRNIPMIKTCVALCPLFGLLGTVTGMVEVFTVMAISGGGNARGMAGGVSRATMPTMAGMVAALSGLFVTTWLERLATRQQRQLEEQLDIHTPSGAAHA
ncbi:MAG: MotA/TolQ/ExbB proton channel family protein [Gammaproteobacteria bacterium AqS3]|nr:MotA/TolQ/ExbB proton channel family protein [Gammaproteobacteria bacterium AqS3]